MLNKNFNILHFGDYWKGSISHKEAIEKAKNEYEKFKIKQDMQYISIMDEMYQKYLNENNNKYN